MALTQWYELRVVGSAGTSVGAVTGVKEGIAIGDNGRLCPLASGGAKKFASEQEAVEFLSKTSIPGIYNFEPVLCQDGPGADEAHVSS